MSDADPFPIERCLVDGCERGPFDDKQSYQGHVNASSSPGHKWSAVKDRLEGGADQGEPRDGSEDGDTDDPGEETSDSGPSEGDEGDEMPTQDEYEEQHGSDRGEETGEEAGESGDGSGGGDTGTGGGGAAAALPMDPKTLGLLLGTALVLWLAYRALSGGDSDAEGIDQGEPGDGPGVDTDTDTQPLGGGLQ